MSARLFIYKRHYPRSRYLVPVITLYGPDPHLFPFFVPLLWVFEIGDNRPDPRFLFFFVFDAEIRASGGIPITFGNRNFDPKLNGLFQGSKVSSKRHRPRNLSFDRGDTMDLKEASRIDKRPSLLVCACDFPVVEFGSALDITL